MSSYTTEFAVADENPLSEGGLWDGGYTNFDDNEVVSNAIRRSTTAPFGTSLQSYNGASFSTSQRASLVVKTSAGIDPVQLSLFVYCAAPSTVTTYRIPTRRNDASAKTRVQKIVAGVLTALALENTSTDWTTGDVLMATIVPGASTNQIDVYKNGVSVISFTDAAIASGARIGVGVVADTITDGEIESITFTDIIATVPKLYMLDGP